MNCMKTVTFSYDDGVTQDQRLIDLFDKYGLKCTFNLNSALGGVGGASLSRDGRTFSHVRFRPHEFARIYKDHEVAAHTLTHPHLYDMPDEELIREVEEDRLALSDLVGYEVMGMAYPFGDADDRIAKVISENTGIKYSRTTVHTYNFEPQTDLIRFNATLHHAQWDKLFELGRQFVDMKPDTPKLFYIWGHSYEFDIDNSWGKFEEFLKLISGKEDIRYCTNKEALLG